MHQIHDPPFFNARKQVCHLFQPQPIPKHNSQTLDFIPFNNQRDKLGRLLSRQNQQRQLAQSRHRSVQFNHKQISKINPEAWQHIKQALKSDKTIQRHFRLNQLKNKKEVKEVNKLRIVSSATGQKIDIPSIGYYDTAEIMDKIKFTKVKRAAITQEKPKTKDKQDNQLNKINKTLKTNVKNYNTNSQPSNNYKKIQIDYNLPQLQRYHQSKKLKMKHYDNFQEDHQKFKNLVRHSLILANKIKKGLQLD